MRLSSRTRAWLLLVGALVVVLAAVLLSRAGGSDTSGSPTARASATVSGSSGTGTTRRTPSSGSATDPVSHLAWVDESTLDAQASDTLARIRAGGPYRYPRNDDVTYHNSNGVLPAERDGYYREYTVVTPGSSTRGARRIIRGSAGELYYTTDHYDTFRRIRPDG